MAKINATYGAGYYVDPSFNYLEVEAKNRKDARLKRLRGEEGDMTMRQTFAAPFTIVCLSCNCRIARGTHAYVNRTKSGDKYLGKIVIWRLQFRCPGCTKPFTLLTDPETATITGGYKCETNCHRPDGDFLTQNMENERIKAELKAEKANADAGASDLDALNKHSQRMEAVHRQESDIDMRVAAANAARRASLEASHEMSGSDPFHPSGDAAPRGLEDLIVMRLRARKMRRTEGEACGDSSQDPQRQHDDADSDDESGDFERFAAWAATLDAEPAAASSKIVELQHAEGPSSETTPAPQPDVYYTSENNIFDVSNEVSEPLVPAAPATALKKGKTLLSRFS